MEQLKNIEQYLLRGEYPTGYTKADKANLCRKCRNFKLEEPGILYYGRNVLNENEPWRICVHTDTAELKVSTAYSHGHWWPWASVAIYYYAFIPCVTQVVIWVGTRRWRKSVVASFGECMHYNFFSFFFFTYSDHHQQAIKS